MHARFLVVLASLLLLAVTLPVGGCGDNDNDVPCCPVCGDGVCGGDEAPCSCSQDCTDGDIVCTQIRPNCGDGICQHSGSPAESHERCPEDCPLDCRACGDRLQVYVDGRVFPGSMCPTGTTEAYRDSGFLVCNACVTATDCDAGMSCHTVCGPGCEDDRGGCCPVRVCSSV
jgi:hypothetical protein